MMREPPERVSAARGQKITPHSEQLSAARFAHFEMKVVVFFKKEIMLQRLDPTPACSIRRDLIVVHTLND
jgi:hypothetical protein